MEKEDLKEIAIHCPTEEDAIQCCELADKLGWRWEGATSYKYNYWKEYKEKTCYNFYKGYYQKKEWYKSRSYEIKSAQWFIDNFSLEKKNVFVYIRGVKDRGQEVIDTLVKLGGTNRYSLDGKNPNRMYFINTDGVIDCICSTWIERHYTEIFLPKEEPKDKQLVWCWDDEYTAVRHLRFYDAQHKCTFRYDGLRNSFKYGNYVPFEGEYPDWAKEALKHLED